MYMKKDWKSIEEPDKKRAAYMRSKEWKEVRELVLDRDRHHCMCCGRGEDEVVLTVHHNTYKHLYEETGHLDDLITVCSVCHLAIHRNKANWSRFKKDTNKQ